MFKYLRNLVKKSKNISSIRNYPIVETRGGPYASLAKNLSWFKQALHQSDDLIIREFINPDIPGVAGALVYIEGLIDGQIVNNQLLSALLRDASIISALHEDSPEIVVDLLQKRIIPIAGIKTCTDLNQAMNSVLSGRTVLFIDGHDRGFAFDTQGWKEREVSEPDTEKVVRGPKVGFVEKLGINIGLVRRNTQNSGLVVKRFVLGQETKTEIAVVYNVNTVVDSTLQEVYNRLQTIQVNNVYDAGILEQALEDSPGTFFPQIMYTERPDVVSANVMEGRIVLLVDGSPFGLIVPAPLALFFQSPEDYYEKWHYGSIIRITRFACAFISTSFPALYISIISYHPELLPTELAFSIGATRLSVPFPAYAEALVMEFTLEVLQEAGVRLPQPVGQTVSIVGGLVIGQAAVQAGIISPIMVIVVSVTAISSFIVPAYNMNLATRLIRVPYILAAVFLGFYGLVLAWLATIVHLCSLTSMGVNYLEGIIPMSRSTLDTLVRAPFKLLNKK